MKYDVLLHFQDQSLICASDIQQGSWSVGCKPCRVMIFLFRVPLLSRRCVLSATFFSVSCCLRIAVLWQKVVQMDHSLTHSPLAAQDTQLTNCRGHQLANQLPRVYFKPAAESEKSSDCGVHD